jgi:hypothetical protein
MLGADFGAKRLRLRGAEYPTSIITYLHCAHTIIKPLSASRAAGVISILSVITGLVANCG